MNFIEKVRAAGIVGAGGAGFPTDVKLNAKAEYFIINAAECEPLIETDKYLCREYADEIVAATVMAAEHVGAEKIVIALKGKYVDEIASLNAAIKKAGAKVTISEMPTFYPAGDEQIMVEFVTGRSVPERGLPLNVGAVVNNVGTMLNLYEAMTKDKPVIDKVLSVTGEVAKTIMLNVPIGTPIRECIDKAGPLIADYAVIIGGPMMGEVLKDKTAIDKAVVTKTTGNLLVLAPDHYLVNWSVDPMSKLKHQTRSACIQCRMCTDLCPRYLIGHDIQPHLVMRNLWREDLIKDDQEYINCFGSALNCCDCRICETFSCPMLLSPAKMNAYFKVKLREKGLDKPRNQEPTARDGLDERRVPTDRLIARLALTKYANNKLQEECIEFVPENVFIPFRQHIGKPALAQVKVGDTVQKGQLIAAAQEGISANIHSSVNGVVKEVGAEGALIHSEGGDNHK